MYSELKNNDAVMRTVTVYLLMFLVIAAIIAGISYWQYAQRGPFTDDFFPIKGWHAGLKLTVPEKDLHAFVDRYDRVVLVARSTPSEDRDWASVHTEWTPLMRWEEPGVLRIHRYDGETREIEWRRDCMIYVDQAGTPTYWPLSDENFQKIAEQLPSWSDVIVTHVAQQNQVSVDD